MHPPRNIVDLLRDLMRLPCCFIRLPLIMVGSQHRTMYLHLVMMWSQLDEFDSRWMEAKKHLRQLWRSIEVLKEWYMDIQAQAWIRRRHLWLHSESWFVYVKVKVKVFVECTEKLKLKGGGQVSSVVCFFHSFIYLFNFGHKSTMYKNNLQLKSLKINKMTINTKKLLTF